MISTIWEKWWVAIFGFENVIDFRFNINEVLFICFKENRYWLRGLDWVKSGR